MVLPFARRFRAVAFAVLPLVLGAGGAFATTADDVCAPSADPCFVTGTVLVTPGSVLDFGSRALVFPGGSGKKLEIAEAPGVPAMTILAGSVTIEPGSAILAKAGFVDIRTTGSVVVRRAGTTFARIDVSDQLSPGALTIETTGPSGDVIIEGTVTAKGTGIDAGGGGVDIVAARHLVLQGEVLAGGGGNSLGGDVTVTTGGSVTSTGTIDVSAGDGGEIFIVSGTGVQIDAAGSAKLVVQGTSAGGDSGDVDIEALDGDVVVSQPILATGAAEIDAGGSGGTISLFAAQGSVTLAGPVSASGGVPDGDGGEVSLYAALDAIHDASATIVARGRTTFGTGGFIDYTAQRQVEVGPIDVTGDCATCFAGDVDVHAFCDVTVPSGVSVVTEGMNGAIRLTTGGTMRVAGILTASGRIDLVHRDVGTPPDLAGAVITPAPIVMVNPLLPQCGCVFGPCGDGVLNCGELCDDGNVVNDAICSADCRRVPRCGDGSVDAFLGETCDDFNQVDCDGCSRSCAMEECGNFVTECEEQCDEGSVGTATCQADCRLPPPPGCGDGALDPATEECDDGNGADCDGCNHRCVVEACGNGVTECDEECDDFGLDACDGCSPMCAFEVCGNGFTDCGEECDDGELNGQPGSACLDEVCRLGEVCRSGGPELCIPCGSDVDCNLCAGMTCDAGGVCVTTGIDCDDANPCTVDGCSPIEGCTHTLLNATEVPACDDGKACTVPECDLDVGCVQRDLEDFEGVTCHFTTLDDLLGDPSVDEKARRVLGKKRAKAAAQVSKAAAGDELGKPKRVKRGLKKARGQLRGMRKKIERFTGSRIDDLGVAAELVGEIDDAVADVEALLQAFGFPI